MTPEHYSHALATIRPRWPDFFRAGWSQLELTCCAVNRWGHHGLALYLRPGQDLGRIWAWCCEILGTGAGERARLYYYRTAPLGELLATVGPHVVPEELRGWRR